jgi:hypothetical protein|tara:strand:- start:461 stop:1276 length:816 start_codon:yes stop_codon:yes gene_type:complete
MANKSVAKVDETKNQIAVFEEYETIAGTGFEEVTAEDLAVPYLKILQVGSPECLPGGPKYNKEAKAGMIANSVADEYYNGLEEGMLVVPCYYNRRFVEWMPERGGWAGSYEPNDPIVKTTTKNEKNEDILPNGNQLTATAQFFVFLVKENAIDSPERAMLPMASTQLKKARKWLSQMQGLTGEGKNGRYVLPMMSQLYRVKTHMEQKGEHTWFGYDIDRVRGLDLNDKAEKSLFSQAVDFAKSIKQGEVGVKSDVNEEATFIPDDEEINVM